MNIINMKLLISCLLSFRNKLKFDFLYINGTMASTDISKKCNGKTYIAIHFLIILFGISAWIGSNGIFIQTPVLINTCPEGWSLPAYLTLVIQSANLGPLLYIILQYSKYKINESCWILCLLILGTSAMGLLIFFYSETTVIAGNEYSLVLFILTFFNGLVGCFSSVLFMPYLRSFNKKCLISYFIGEGLSGVLPSVVALIQGAGDTSECTIFKNNTDAKSLDSLHLNFSPSEYFLFIFIVLFLSLTAFTVLEYCSIVKRVRSISIVLNEEQVKVTHDYHADDIQKKKHNSLERSSFFRNNNKHFTEQTRNYLFILLGIFCFLSHGFYPSIQSYSCLPYGNMAYKLSITFAQLANPLVCLLTFWLKISNIKVINYLSIICLVIGSYVTYLALMSPSPPLQATKLGIFLVIISWTVLVGFISYLKLNIVSILRSSLFPNILFNTGLIMQISSASGAIFSFIIINFTNYFEMYDDCA